MHTITNIEAVREILVIRLNKIGDMICAIPLIKTLRRNFKNAEITVFTEEPSIELLEGSGLADGFIVYKKDRRLLWNRHLECLRLLKKHKREAGIGHFDIAIAVKGGFSSFLAAITFLSGARIRIGYVSPEKRLSNLFYNFPVDPIDIPRFHQVDACLNLLTALGIKEMSRDITIDIPAEHKAAAMKFLREKGLQPKERLAVFNISNNRDASKWDVDNFIKFGRAISQRYGYNCIITCVPADKEKAVKICDGLSGNGFLHDTSKLMDFAAITSVANLLVAGDGGAIHIGAAAGAKVIALFGQTNPVIYGPYGEGHTILKSHDGNVNSITPDDVIRAVRI
ncbi:MAG: glycosyltransferase family 9 protein [Thermodesulfovibrionales bacterium]|nr:glycosyltransferase family 9 protein [Thermodesulfovibrionales bacterium]